MAKDYGPGDHQSSYSGKFFAPQDIAFSKTVTEKTPIAPSAPGVYEGIGETAAAGVTKGDGFTEKNS